MIAAAAPAMIAVDVVSAEAGWGMLVVSAATAVAPVRTRDRRVRIMTFPFPGSAEILPRNGVRVVRMRSNVRFPARAARGIALAACFAVALTSRAGATGVLRIQHSDGTVRTYSGVVLRFSHDTLRVRSADRAGVLEVHTAACTFSDVLERCFPSGATLRQSNGSHDIPIVHGTVFVNRDNAPHRLHSSSQEIGPNGVLAVFRTQRGTFVSVRGVLDGGAR